MSQICRYYLRGACKYGPRCHFLHENADYSYKENYSGYSKAGYHDKYYSSSSNYYNKNTSSYGRYHVDNRSQNQVVAKSLSNDDIFEIVQQELSEFEKCHKWIFTVIAPLSDFGNIPGLEDLSPEELRYQYYESCLSNSLQEFAQNLNIAKNNVAHICRIFDTKSSAAYEIVKIMTQKQKTEEMATDNRSAAASTFKFDLNALSKPPVFATQPVQSSDQQFSKMPVEVTGSVFPSGDFSVTPNNFPVNQFGGSNFESNSTNNFIQQSPALSSFSFNLNKLQPSQNAPSVFQSSRPFGNPNSNMNPSIFNNPNSMVNSNNSTSNANVFNNLANVSATIENSVYSKPEEIPTDALSTFQEKFFKIGHIPLVAPSKELCYN